MLVGILMLLFLLKDLVREALRTVGRLVALALDG